jgi:hypothetical protein
MQSFTFVTAIIDVDSQCREETLQFKMEQLSLLLIHLQTSITIFADRGSFEILNSTYKDRKNITIILFKTSEGCDGCSAFKGCDGCSAFKGWKESWIYKASLPYMDRLPLTRNQTKDTFEHLILTHMKIEFLHKAIENCKNSIFCWIDPHICHLFSNPLSSINYLNYLSHQKYTDAPFLALPGCWDFKVPSEPSVDFNTVCWRFCGSFMIGDTASIIGLNTLYKHFYPTLLKERNTMTWDVNFLAQLESEGVCNPNWYRANHDASIVRIPTSLYSQNLSDSMDTLVKYDYPEVPGFFPSSASYIEGSSNSSLDFKKTLITRYVNYKIGPDGRYTVFHPSGQLQTRNLISTLSDDFTTIIDSQFLDDSTIGIPTYMEGARYVGLEDVRTFKIEDGIGFVASSAAYTPDHSIRIVKGVIRDGKIVSGVVLQPPNGIYTPCEKNWIPIFGNKSKPDSYIYRWHPYEIICADDKGITTIISSKVIPNTLFEKVRGSTVPIWSDSCYICVVHWTETVSSKGTLEYYHMLVKLDQDYNVTAWSQPFHFTIIGIQYCLGFAIVEKDKYGFWFSENDGNPQFMRSCSSQFSFVGLDGKCVA